MSLYRAVLPLVWKRAFNGVGGLAAFVSVLWSGIVSYNAREEMNADKASQLATAVGEDGVQTQGRTSDDNSRFFAFTQPGALRCTSQHL
jgi:hypothetical protein